MLEDVGGESSRNQAQEGNERESQIARKKKNWSDSRESKAVNEAEQVRCVDRFLSSLKKAKILTSEPLHLYSVAIYSAQIWTGELG